MAAPKYYSLVAGLPHLEHFESAEYVAITWQQLESRLRLLSADHKQQLDLAIGMMLWQKQPRERTTRELTVEHRRATERITDPVLREFVEYRMGLRTVVIALRMRRRSESPQAGVPWGTGRWARKIAAHWDDIDFSMGSVFPWIEQARVLVDNSSAMDLEWLLLDATWRQLNMVENQSSFGFERVVAFVFKWEIVKRWLSYDADVAKNRFQSLITEVIREHEQLFA
jgi:hypothetical protein